jgi:ferrochelatase
MYNQIGGKSPILEITTAQAEALEGALNQESATAFKVYIGMRYWHPFMKDTVQKICDDGIKLLIVLSLYPHYSKATTGSSIIDFKKAISGKDIKIQYIEQWPDFPAYIDAMAELVAEGVSDFKDVDCDILYSAHSLPQSFIDEGDPYLDHIKITIEKVNERLSTPPYNLKDLTWHLSFQSKAGPVKWLEPSTEIAIERLGKGNGKNLLVVPISFVSDHIETLYEIDILYRELAEKYGIRMKRCEALNTSEKFILAMRDLIMSKVK